MVLFLLSNYSLNAQRRITGSVLSTQNEPVIGAVIKDSESNRATVTDVEGNFSIEISGQSKSLLISFVGYNTSKIILDSRVNYVISLTPLQEINNFNTGAKIKKGKSPFWSQFGLNPQVNYEVLDLNHDYNVNGGYKYDIRYNLIRVHVDIQTPYINIPYSFSVSKSTGNNFDNGKVNRFGFNILPLGIYLNERSKDGISVISRIVFATTNYERNTFKSVQLNQVDNRLFFYFFGYRFGESTFKFDELQSSGVKSIKTSYKDIYYLDMYTAFRKLGLEMGFENYKYSIRKGFNKVETDNQIGLVGLSYFKHSRSGFIKFLGALVPLPYFNLVKNKSKNTYYDTNGSVLGEVDDSQFNFEYGLAYYRLIPLHRIRTFIAPACIYNVGREKEFRASIGIITII